MDILPGDVLVVWDHGFVNEAIQAVTHGPNHVAMFKDANTVIEAQAGRLVGESDLSFYLNSNARLEVWTDPTLSDEQRRDMVEYAKSLYGIPYDYVLIPLELLHFELGLPINWFHENKHRICSSLVYDIAQHEEKRWADGPNCAPVDLITFGALQKRGELSKRAGP